MATTPEQQAQAMIDNLPTKTGKSLEEWLKICGRSGLEKHGEIVNLSSTSGLRGFAYDAPYCASKFGIIYAGA